MVSIEMSLTLPQVFHWILTEGGLTRHPTELRDVFKRVLVEAKKKFLCCMCRRSATMACGHCHQRIYCSVDCQARDCDENAHHVTCKPAYEPPGRRLTLSSTPITFKVSIEELSEDNVDDEDDADAMVEDDVENTSSDVDAIIDFDDFEKNFNGKRKREDSEGDTMVTKKSRHDEMPQEQDPESPIMVGDGLLFEVIHNVLLDACSDSPEMMLVVYLLSQLSRTIADRIGEQNRSRRHRIRMPMPYYRMLFTGVIRSHSVDLIKLYGHLFISNTQTLAHRNSAVALIFQRLGYEEREAPAFVSYAVRFLLPRLHSGGSAMARYLLDGRIARAIDERNMDEIRREHDKLSDEEVTIMYEGIRSYLYNTASTQAFLTAIVEDDCAFVEAFTNYIHYDVRIDLIWLQLTRIELLLLTRSAKMAEIFINFLPDDDIHIFFNHVMMPRDEDGYKILQHKTNGKTLAVFPVKFVHTIADFRYVHEVMTNPRREGVIKMIYRYLHDDYGNKANKLTLGIWDSTDSLVAGAPDYSTLTSFLSHFKPISRMYTADMFVVTRELPVTHATLAIFMSNTNFKADDLNNALDGGMLQGISTAEESISSLQECKYLLGSMQSLFTYIIFSNIDAFAFARVPEHVTILRQHGLVSRKPAPSTAFALYIVHKNAGTLGYGTEVAKAISNEVYTSYNQFEQADILDTTMARAGKRPIHAFKNMYNQMHAFLRTTLQ